MVQRKKRSKKTLYKGWLPVDDKFSDSIESAPRVQLEEAIIAIARSLEPTQAYNATNSECAKILSDIIIRLYPLGVTLQSAHWRSMGESFYGDHLLYQKLYEDVSSELDDLAEKLMMCDQNTSVLMPHSLLSLSTAQVLQSHLDILACVVQSEDAFLSLLYDSIAMLEKIESTPHGVLNMLQGFADKHEKHKYLLARRSK